MASSVEKTVELIRLYVGSSHDIPRKNQLSSFLDSLCTPDKVQLTKSFINIPWDMGSVHILALLQENYILTATQFILRQENNEQAQLILNDFFESQYSLLANLITNCKYDLLNSTKLTAIIEDAVSSLVTDLIVNPEIVGDLKYMKELHGLVPKEIYLAFQQLHLDVFLKQYDSNLSIKEAFRDLSEWCNEACALNPLRQLLEEVTFHNQVELLGTMFENSLKEHFSGWKLYVLMLKMYTKNQSSTSDAFVKAHLKTLFKDSAGENKLDTFSILLLTARVIYHQKDDIQSYKQWFKQTFGDMKYQLTTAEFRTIMGYLSSLISYEVDGLYLQAHVNTAISAPALCNELVLSYKSNCRCKIEALDSGHNSTLKQVNENLSASIILSSDTE